MRPAPSPLPPRDRRRPAVGPLVSTGILVAALALTGCGSPAPAPSASSEAPSASASDPGASSAGPTGARTAVERAELYPCTGYGRLTRFNSAETNAEDVYAWAAFPPAQVGDGRGDVDWAADPYGDAGWRLWLSSLRWIGPSIEAARDGDDDAFRVADRVIRDWVADHRGGWGDDPDDAEANHHRMNVLLCFRGVVAERAAAQGTLPDDGTLPQEYAWLDEVMEQHVEQNKGRYSKRHNHGSMENKALLGAGCVLDRPEWMDHAMARVEADLPYQVDEQGLSNEAAPHYAEFNYTLFQDLDETSRRCGLPSTVSADRVALMGRALPHMVDSTGAFWQYGDSAEFPVKPFKGAGDQLRYAATDGEEGIAPPQRILAFTNGPVFGRSSWGDAEDGFRDEAAWMLRTGTGTEKKAHRGDLLQFLYSARGRQIVEDGGHPGIVQDDWRPWGLGPTAHNVIHLPTLDEFPGEGPVERTAVVESADGSADGAAARQSLTVGGERARSVLVLTGPDAAVVVDRTAIAGDPVDPVIETLWNLPAEYAAERVGQDTVRAVDAERGEATTIVQARLDGAGVAEDGIRLHRGERDDSGGHGHRGWHYPEEQVREEATQVAFRSEGSQAGIVSVLIPAAAAEDVGVATRRESDGTLALTVRGSGGAEARVRVAQDGTITRLD